MSLEIACLPLKKAGLSLAGGTGGAAAGEAAAGQTQLAQQLEHSRQELLRFREDAEHEASAILTSDVYCENERRTLIEGKKQARRNVLRQELLCREPR